MPVDDLTDRGANRMTEAAMDEFLTSQRVGVLGLPDDGPPTLRPLSYTYVPSERALYLLFVGDGASSKRDLSDRAEAARFLVYSVESPFSWRSVLLTGEIDAVPETELAAVEDRVPEPWQPALLAAASDESGTRLYRFTVTERTGLSHAGLPDGFESESDADTGA